MNRHQTASRTADIEAITKIINGQYGSWDARDADMLIDRFDRDYPAGTYLPGEELKHLSIDGAHAYVSRFTTLFKVLEHTLRDIVIDFPTDDVAYALAYPDVSYTLEGVSGEQLAPYHTKEPRRVRDAYVLHRKDGQWKIIHFQESMYEYMRTDELKAYQLPYVEKIQQALNKLAASVPEDQQATVSEALAALTTIRNAGVAVEDEYHGGVRGGDGASA